MNISDKLERARQRLYNAIDKYGLDSEEVKRISVKLDKLINEQYDHEVLYPVGVDIKENYYKCIGILKITVEETGSFPTVKEWNKYAKEYILLNTVSIEYISKMNWCKLEKYIRLEIK